MNERNDDWQVVLGAVSVDGETHVVTSIGEENTYVADAPYVCPNQSWH